MWEVYRDGQTREFYNLRDGWADSFIDSTKDFIEAIGDDRPPVATDEDGRELIKFSLAAMKSAEINAPVVIDSLEEYRKE